MKQVKLILICILAVLVSCEDIIEPDLSGEIVNLLSPPDGHQTTLSTQTFWWDEVEKAEGYNLQVVSPSFNYIERLFLDTNIQVNKYTLTLLPGEYEWRVRAYNYSTSTNYTTFTFTIDSTYDISQEIIQLINPVNFDTSNLFIKQFSWVPLYNADEYNFQLYFENDVVSSNIIEYDTITIFLENGEGSYRWEVRGQNAFSNTIYSSRYLFIDTTAPGKPVLVEPENNALLSDSVTNFEWIRDQGSGSSVMDSFYVFEDENLNNIVLQKYLTVNTYSDSLEPGVYFWKVISFDAAGNKSLPSDVWNFTVDY